MAEKGEGGSIPKSDNVTMTIRLPIELKQWIEEMAAQECEGNTSMMFRKLIKEKRDSLLINV